jgi:ABC-type Fe3+ transport system permease subunit
MNTQDLLHSADRFSTWAGKTFAWLIVLLMLVVCAEVFKRYALNAPTAWIYDVNNMMYGTLFMMCGAYTLAQNGHVRGNFLYGSMAILVLSTIIHYYTSSHLTAVTALKALDNEFESVSASLKVPFYKTFFRVTMPVCMPAILDIARYLFINAMVTLSAVIFLYSPDTKLASVAIVSLDESGEIGPAAAMATLIVATSTVVCVIYALLTRVLLRRTQAWRSNG